MSLNSSLRRSARALVACAAAAGLSLTASAQTTHMVDTGPAFEFTPANLTVEVGDTVTWTWQGGLHNVESGVGGVGDGNFDSGSPTNVVGTTFSVTFDALFVANNPMPGGVYPYYCVVHEAFGQTGSITVVAPAGTHFVDNGPAFEFSPANLTINVGDTVVWTWLGGFHNVESGVGGVGDGNFTSGAPTATIGTTFSVTFDAAFLAANPMSGNAYPYYCLVHEAFGQVGTITVNQISAYGGCNSTPGSLVHLAGSPDIGTSFTVGVDDPVSSSPIGSITALFVSVFPDPNFPCGTPLPGFGMTGPVGDLLVNLLPPDPAATLIGPAWTGAPAPIVVGIPNLVGLAGLTVYAQGALTGLGPSRLTEGLEISIGLP